MGVHERDVGYDQGRGCLVFELKCQALVYRRFANKGPAGEMGQPSPGSRVYK